MDGGNEGGVQLCSEHSYLGSYGSPRKTQGYRNQVSIQG